MHCRRAPSGRRPESRPHEPADEASRSNADPAELGAANVDGLRRLHPGSRQGTRSILSAGSLRHERAALASLPIAASEPQDPDSPTSAPNARATPTVPNQRINPDHDTSKWTERNKRLIYVSAFQPPADLMPD
jgi:hypothetical protein